MCAMLTGISIHCQLLFLSSFPSTPAEVFSELPLTKNIRDICRSVSDNCDFHIFPFMLYHFHSYPTLFERWFSQYLWLPVVCLASTTWVEAPFLYALHSVAELEKTQWEKHISTRSFKFFSFFPRPWVLETVHCELCFFGQVVIVRYSFTTNISFCGVEVEVVTS